MEITVQQFTQKHLLQGVLPEPDDKQNCNDSPTPYSFNFPISHHQAINYGKIITVKEACMYP